jgi:hypothetical protein
MLASHPAFQDDFDYDSVVYPKRSQEEIDQDIEYFVSHPLNARELTPELLQMPEFQAL